MPQAAPASINLGLKLGAIAPQDAFEQFASRRLLRPSFRWQEVYDAEHARGFAVAGVMRLDVLQLFYDELEAAAARGTSLADFSKAVKARLVQKGFWGNVEVTDPKSGEIRVTKFNDARLRLIFDANMRQSHAAGRWQRGMRGRMTHIVYRTMGDEQVRTSHRPWDWICLPRDHPFWDTHIPPNGWNCRCYFYFVAESDIPKLQAAAAAKGKVLLLEPPPIQYVDFRNTASGRIERVPRGIDPGWAYNPGRSHIQRAIDRQVDGLNRLHRLRETGPVQGEPSQVAPRAPAAAVQATPAQLADAGHALTRAVLNKQRGEPGFAAFLKSPPKARPGEPPVGMPVAAVPPLQAGTAGAAPVVASVNAADLIAQQSGPGYPFSLPTTAAQWALAQVIIDRGQRLVLGGSPEQVLWWWLRGSRVDTVLLERGELVWWVKAVSQLTLQEALDRHPRLASVINTGGPR